MVSVCQQNIWQHNPLSFIWTLSLSSTSTQLQFSLCIIHAVHSLYIDCNFPKWMHYTLIGYATSFLVLFTNFYIHAYIKKRGRKAKAQRSAREASSQVEQEANGVIPDAKSPVVQENGSPSQLFGTETKKEQ